MKNKTKINIPIYDGESTLDVIKILIYHFYYNYMMPKWSKNNVHLIYMDTDSLVLSRCLLRIC